ncbi:MAG: transporter substrate-binding domain-containing protein [Ketobacteraceae bacterium]|nr:transporter substrate-binding domain-containing protein [Ketobacteraceae bacterium]
MTNVVASVLGLFCGIAMMSAAVNASPLAQDEEESNKKLVLAYWDNATPPFAILENGELKAGIIYDIGQNLAKRLNVRVEYKLVPTKRIERELLSGGIDLDCITSPIWKENPDAYLWSPVLFTGADRFLLQKQSDITISSVADLKGLRVGVYPGYTYHDDVMKMLNSGAAHRVPVKGVDHGIKLLLAGRIDTLIDFGVLLRHKIKTQGLYDQLVLADAPADEFELRCACSPKARINRDMLSRQLQAMVNDSTIARILARYQ